MKIVRIRAVWCMSCLLMNKRFSKVLKKLPPIEVVDWDYDTDTSLFEPYQIGSTLPVFLQLDDSGTVLRKLVGEHSEVQLASWIEEGLR